MTEEEFFIKLAGLPRTSTADRKADAWYWDTLAWQDHDRKGLWFEFIGGVCNSFRYNPLTAVATELTAKFYDVSNKKGTFKGLGLERKVFNRIWNAIYQHAGYDRKTRLRLLETLGLPAYKA